MGEKDTTEKVLVDYNDVFADINMPFRIIGYDGASYRSQLLDDRKCIVPVVTFELYFGTSRRWGQKRSIRELIKIPNGG